MDIRNIVIVGAGMMGKGIAQVFSSCKDLNITLYDVKDFGALDGIRANMEQLKAKDILTAEEIDTRMERISFTTDFDAPCFLQADLVVECVFEDMKVKQDLFVELEKKCLENTIFATNTSVMSPTEIAAKIVKKERLVGTHFWNPAHLIPLVEVVKSDYTSDAVAKATLDVLERAGKVAVLCKKDVPGFIANRMQHALWREAISIMENGIADAETIDKAVKNSFGLRLPQLGPMENIDMVGTDLTYNIHAYLLKHLENATEPSKMIAELKEQGNIGFKTGTGIRSWTPEEIEKSKYDLNEYLIKMVYNK